MEAGWLGLRLTHVFRWGFGFVCAALRWAGKLLSKTRPISASMPNCRSTKYKRELTILARA